MITNYIDSSSLANLIFYNENSKKESRSGNCDKRHKGKFILFQIHTEYFYVFN